MPLQTIAETPVFSRLANKLFNEEERSELTHKEKRALSGLAAAIRNSWEEMK